MQSGYMVAAIQKMQSLFCPGVWIEFDMRDMFQCGSSPMKVYSHRKKKKVIDQGICQIHSWGLGVGLSQQSRKNSAVGLRCYLMAKLAFAYLMTAVFLLVLFCS